jgi:hypothetical protein
MTAPAARESPLLAQLCERVATTRRLEQEGTEQCVVGQPRRHELQRLGVVGNQRTCAGRGDDLLGPGALAHQHLAFGRRRETPWLGGRAFNKQLALGRLDFARDQAQLAGATQGGHIGDAAGSHARG